MQTLDQKRQTRDQRRANLAYKQISELQKNTPRGKEYGRYAHKLPILIRQAGLAQALAFAHAKNSAGGCYQLISDLGAQLGVNDLLAMSRTADLLTYQKLTREALAVLLWYKRFAQSVLEIDAGTED